MPSNNYTRQKTAEIQDNLVINASIFNAEYNQIQLAFSYNSTGETGHTHSGAIGEGGAIGKIGNQDFSKSLEISTNDWIFTGSSVQPATNNTTDLGVSGKGWKDVYISGNVDLADNAKVLFGASNALQIYHTGTASLISETGTGDLFIRSSNALRLQSAENENYLVANANGSLNLYYDNAEKLATTNTGIDVTGIISADDQIIIASNDLQVAAQPTLTLRSNENASINNQLAEITFQGHNDQQVDQTYVYMRAESPVITDNQEEGKLKFFVRKTGNAYANSLSVDSSGIDVTGTIECDTSLQIQSSGSSVDAIPDLYMTNIETAADAQNLGMISFRGYNDASTPTIEGYANIYAQQVDVSDGAEKGKLVFQARNGATYVEALEVNKDGIDVTGTVNADAIKFTTDSTDDAKIFIESSGGEQTSLVIQSKDNLDDLIILRHHIAGVGGVDTLTTNSVGATFRGGLKFKPQTGDPTGTFSISQIASGSGLIRQVGDGNILIRGQEGYIQNDSGDALVQWGGSDVSLHWRGAGATGTKLVTTATGVNVTGDVAATTVTVGDGTSTDLKLYKDVSNNCFIEQRGTGGLEISGIYGKLSNESNQELISWDTDNAALSWRGATGAGLKLITTQTGIDVTGTTNTDNLTINGAQGTDGQVLTSTGSGVAWEDAATGGGGSVTGVTGTAPIVSSGGTSPAISITQASGSTNGYLSSSDWTTFNNKGAGTLTSVGEGTAIDINTSNPAIPVISVDLTELNVGADNLVGSTDHLVYLDNGNQKKILVNNVNLSAFDNDSGWTSSSGTVTNVSGGTGISVSNGTTTPSVSITSNSIGATQLNVAGNGATTEFLRSDGDGTFTWAIPADTNTTYTADNTTINLSGTQFSVKDNSIGATQLNVSGNGSTAQFLRSDGDGTFTWATPVDTDTNTTYTAGTGLSLNGTQFNLALNELSTTTTADTTSGLVLAGTVGNQILLANIGNHLFGQDVQELTGFGPMARRANSIKVFDTSSGDITGAWATSVEGAYYTVHVIGPNDVNYNIPSGTTVYITGPSGLITRTTGTVTIKGGSSCTVTAYGSTEKFIYTGNNVTYS